MQIATKRFENKRQTIDSNFYLITLIFVINILLSMFVYQAFH